MASQQLNSKKVLSITLSFILFLFFATRYWVFFRSDIEYSDADHFHRNFASTWDLGLKPYKDIPFDYAPQSIPFMYLPHYLEWHLGISHYYRTYRVANFLLELLSLITIIVYQVRKQVRPLHLLLTGMFFAIGGLVAQYYLYEGVDIFFILTLITAIAILKKPRLKSYVKSLAFWILVFWSTAVKFVTLPLLIPFALVRINKTNSKRELGWGSLAFLIVWGIPLGLYRTSLITPIIIQGERPLHLSSFPAYIVQTINAFTQTETLHFLEYFGPLTQKALFASTILLALGILLLYYYLMQFKKHIINTTKDQPNNSQLLVRITLTFLLWFILSSKIYSPPFNIWLIMVMSLWIFDSYREQITIYLLTLFILIENMTNWFFLGHEIFIYPLTWDFVQGITRFVPIILLFIWSVKKLHSQLNYD